MIAKGTTPDDFDAWTQRALERLRRDEPTDREVQALLLRAFLAWLDGNLDFVRQVLSGPGGGHVGSQLFGELERSWQLEATATGLDLRQAIEDRLRRLLDEESP